VRKRKGAVLAAGSVALALALSACGGTGKSSTTTNSSSSGNDGFNAAVTSIVRPSTQKGGTLKFVSSQDADSWDPTIGYYAFVWNMERYYTRTLLTYKPGAGKDGLTLVPDLAAAMPTVSSDKLTYTFKLKPGIKYEDGSVIKAQDIKYGIERNFAQDVLSGGPLYMISEFDQGQNYPGPYKDTDPNKLGLKTIETPDDNTIVFHLKTPFADLVYQVAMGITAPVPQAKDTGEKYAQHPFSSGPYKFDTYSPGKSLKLVRNTNWDQSTDTVRKALPDEIDLEINSNADDIDNRLIAGTADLDVGQTGVQSAAQIKILQDPKLKANTDDPVSGFIRYIAMSTKVPPLDNVDCRKAVIYAADHTALQTARGGPFGGGDIAPNMIPTNIGGADPSYDPYNMVQGKPQVDKAKAALTACGQPNGFTTKIAVRNNKPKEVKTAEALQASLKAVGINTEIFQYDGSKSSTTVGSPTNVHANDWGLIIQGWGPDWNTGYGMLQPLVDGRTLVPSGNNDYSEVNDKSINDLFDKAAQETDPAKASDIYKQINQKIMEQALYLPEVYDKAFNYRNPRLTNVFVNGAYGMIDFQSLGVSDGK
jgi:peptide/nickel transport system substrate-binding protein